MNNAPRLWNANYIKVWLANFMIFFSFMLIMPLLPIYLSEEFGAGKHTIGVVLSGYTVMALVARLFSGYIVDTFNRRTVLLVSYGLFAFFFLGYLIGGSLILFALIRTIHGAPFGTTTVSNSTVAIDVLHPQRRAEGIGYYGLSNNLATAISPTIGLYMYEEWHNYQAIFILSFVMALTGFLINSTVRHPNNDSVLSEEEKGHEVVAVNKRKKTIKDYADKFFLVEGWGLGVTLACLSFSYGVLSTYLAIYGKEQLGITSGTGAFFLVLSVCLMISRLTGGHMLRRGEALKSATQGMCLSVFSYLLFAAVNNYWGYFGCAVILGLGNGHMFPAVQNLFVNLAPVKKRGTANSSMLTSWDVGIGAGVIVGGIVSELFSYNAAFWIAWAVNVCGVAFFLLHVSGDYVKKMQKARA